jgi:hypothetical protein
VLARGALLGRATLGLALLAGHPAMAVLGFAGMGLGRANLVPIVFGAAGRMAGLAPGIGILRSRARATSASSSARR